MVLSPLHATSGTCETSSPARRRQAPATPIVQMNPCSRSGSRHYTALQALACDGGATPAHCRPVVRGVRPSQWRCQMAELPPPPEGIVLAHFIVSDDVERS